MRLYRQCTAAAALLALVLAAPAAAQTTDITPIVGAPPAPPPAARAPAAPSATPYFPQPSGPRAGASRPQQVGPAAVPLAPRPGFKPPRIAERPDFRPGACAAHADFVDYLQARLQAQRAWRGRQRAVGEGWIEFELYDSHLGWAVLRVAAGRACVLDLGEQRMEARMVDAHCLPEAGYMKMVRELSGLEMVWTGLNRTSSFVYSLYADRSQGERSERWALYHPVREHGHVVCTAETGTGSETFRSF